MSVTVWAARCMQAFSSISLLIFHVLVSICAYHGLPLTILFLFQSHVHLYSSGNCLTARLLVRDGCAHLFQVVCLILLLCVLFHIYYVRDDSVIFRNGLNKVFCIWTFCQAHRDSSGRSNSGISKWIFQNSHTYKPFSKSSPHNQSLYKYKTKHAYANIKHKPSKRQTLQYCLF